MQPLEITITRHISIKKQTRPYSWSSGWLTQRAINFPAVTVIDIVLEKDSKRSVPWLDVSAMEFPEVSPYDTVYVNKLGTKCLHPCCLLGRRTHCNLSNWLGQMNNSFANAAWSRNFIDQKFSAGQILVRRDVKFSVCIYQRFPQSELGSTLISKNCTAKRASCWGVTKFAC